ncbi:MAG: SIMPL domain-containing protein [Anaerolineaceae bacterium]|jgi:hypothetical protein
MKNRSLLVVLSLIGVIALAACSGGTPVVTTSSQTTPNVRSITVTGTGEVYVTPDVAYIDIGVQNTAATVTDALKQNTAQAQAIRAALTVLKVDDKDIQTSNFSVNPQPQYAPDGTLKSTQYSANNTVSVTVRDLSSLGQILDAVVNSGANTINSISFDLLNKDDAYAQARQKAVDDARSQADALAKAAGVQLGDVQTINVYSINPVVPSYEGKGGGAMSAANSSVPIATGQMLVSVQVNIVWELK